MDSYQIPRHKVFISYYHKEDQSFKNYLIGLKEYNFDTCSSQSIFDDYSVRENDIDDTGMNDEDIRREIRDNYIKDATVLILLCGEHTKERKFVDWELHAAMFNTNNNPKMGIIVVNLPSIFGKNCIHSGQEDEKQIIGNSNINWFQITSRKEYETKFPYLPSRIIDNFESQLTQNTIVPITVVDWCTIEDDNVIIKTLVDNAYKRSRDKTKHYNHSSPLRCRNTH